METISKQQQERLSKRLYNIINKKLSHLSKEKIKDEENNIYSVVLIDNKSYSELEDEVETIIEDTFFSVNLELGTSLRKSFKYDKITKKYENTRERDYRIDFKRLSSLNLAITIDYFEFKDDDNKTKGFYLKPYILTYKTLWAI